MSSEADKKKWFQDQERVERVKQLNITISHANVMLDKLEDSNWFKVTWTKDEDREEYQHSWDVPANYYTYFRDCLKVMVLRERESAVRELERIIA